MLELGKMTQQYQEMNLGEGINYDQKVAILFTFHSTTIEGSELSLEDTTMLLTEGFTGDGKMEHYQMNQDHYQAHLFAMGAAKNKEPITPELIRNIGSKVMRSTGDVVNAISGQFDVSKGEFRKVSVYAGTRYFPDQAKVPGLITGFCENLAPLLFQKLGVVECFELAVNTHYNFLSVHPFGDGNGRCARILMNYVQAMHGYPMIITDKDRRKEYIDAIERVRTGEDSRALIDHLKVDHLRFLKEEIDLELANKRSPGISFVF